MRTLFTILLFFFLTSLTVVVGQTKTREYQLVFGKDTFQTMTTTSRDSFDKKTLREDSYLFKNQSQVIKIPRRIDRVRRFSSSYPSGSIVEIDTVDQVEVDKIVDTIGKLQLTYIINSEIQVYDGHTKLKFAEAHFEAIQPDGKTSFTVVLQKTKILDGKHAFESISSIREGGYLIFHTIWFYDKKQHRREIECNIAWMIR